ncbi:MAG: penicillin-binding protein 2 [Flavobacteriales bacterium]|nr:penicillin-binding protein 2 [Flavobacteriales bacterium]
MNLKDRRILIIVLFILIIGIFIGRLFQLQVAQDKWKYKAAQITERAVTKYPSRGVIYDRNGKLLVGNIAVYDLMVVPREVKDLDTIAFSKLVGVKPHIIKKGLDEARAYSYHKASPLIKQIPADEYVNIAENLSSYKGFYTQVRSMRAYPDSIAAHALGYISEVSPRIVDEETYYRSGDYIGANGVENIYEEVLRGNKGTEIMLVDVHNNVRGKFEDGRYDTASVAGRTITSSLDIELQKYGERLMKNKRGSIVAIEPATGEILAMVNNPKYDPNLLVGRVRSQNYSALLNDTLKPLFNRALQAKYPPGSTFKLVNALIGLQEGTVTPNTYHSCRGGYYFGRRKLGCHGHVSPLKLDYSIITSCNAYYCNVFKDIIDKYPTSEEGYKTWREYVTKFGLGSRLMTDMTGEVDGFVPPHTYYDRFYGEGRWKPHTIISLSIGQGELGVTPLQMANMCATIANRGWYITPHVIKELEGEPLTDSTYTIVNRTGIDKEYFEIVVDAMEGVIERGTGRGVKFDDTAICGKTGTAQNPHGKDHSIFIAFAPKDNPKIAIAVYVENVGFGSTWAAPITSLMIEKYLNGGETNRTWVEQRILEANLMHEN